MSTNSSLTFNSNNKPPVSKFKQSIPSIPSICVQVRTIKIRNTTEAGGTSELATEEELRKATEKLTLSCLSPNTLHRDRSKTHNPQLFSGSSSFLVFLLNTK